jgi:energy-coupling factor transporter ATP-binding protein EcfA2
VRGHGNAVAFLVDAFATAMDINLTIENYRCFPSGNPVSLTLTKGFSAFVGVNNSGKSSLLKFFYEMRPIFNPIGANVNVIQQLFGGGKLPVQPPPEILDRDEMFFNGNRGDIRIEVGIGGFAKTADIITKAVVQLERAENACTVKFFNAGNAEISLANWSRSNGSPVWAAEDVLKGSTTNASAHFKHIRSAFKVLADTYYVPAFRHISPLTPADGAVQTYYDINVGRPFIEMWHGLQAGASKQGQEQIYKLIEEIKDNFAFKQLQISAAQNRNTLRLMIDGKPFALQELGAGLVQFIVVLGNAAFRKPSFILIDEPEISLHPSLQLKFMTKLAGHASEGVIFATHNIGLARAVAEETYSVSAGAKGSEIKRIDRTPRLAELLGELNYEGYRPLGFSKVLLVEGRTSVKVFVELLRLFNKDHEFLVVPMSDMIHGNSRDELQEVTRICPHTFAIIDSERQNAGDHIKATHEEFAQNCRALQIDCLILEYRAIENYLSDRAIKVAQGATYRALAPFEGRQGLNLWPKTENWKIARAMVRAEIEATDLGQFLARI